MRAAAFAIEWLDTKVAEDFARGLAIVSRVGVEFSRVCFGVSRLSSHARIIDDGGQDLQLIAAAERMTNGTPRLSTNSVNFVHFSGDQLDLGQFGRRRQRLALEWSQRSSYPCPIDSPCGAKSNRA